MVLTPVRFQYISERLICFTNRGFTGQLLSIIAAILALLHLSLLKVYFILLELSLDISYFETADRRFLRVYLFYGILSPVSELTFGDIAQLYARFESPIAALNCGDRCAPHNERGVPFCCDLTHAIPAAYQAEWAFLQEKTDLWRLWKGEDKDMAVEIQDQTPEGQVLIACRGHALCQRGFRSISCRSFPFFPYIDSRDEFIGLSYYWEYEDRCWVISNLSVVSFQYCSEFIAAYEALFEWFPEEKDTYQRHAERMRETFARRRRRLPLLHRDGYTAKISPQSERMQRVPIESLPKFGPYRIAAGLPFPDELG
jgi:hypothetical protein